MTSMKCSNCDVVKTVLSLLFTGVMALAIVGVHEAHGGIGAPHLGSSQASLSILALVISLKLWTTNLDCSNCPDAKYQKYTMFVILIVATIIALMNLYFAHISNGIIVIGTVESSLSLLAFAITSTYWANYVRASCAFCTPH